MQMRKAHILHREVVKAIKEMKDKKAIGNDDVPGDVLKLLGEDGLKIVTRRSTTYMKLESGQRSS